MSRTSVLEPVVLLATMAQWLFLSTLTGALVGTGVSLFLHALSLITTAGISSPSWFQILLLPAGGLLNGLLLFYGYRFLKSSHSDDITPAFYEQEGRMPLKSMLIKPIAALITLGSGGSAGKESPASHIGASIGAAIGGAFRLNSEIRKRLVACGVSAGFASVFGTPIAGAIYGVEVLAIGRVRTDFLLPAIIGGVTAWQTSQYWGVPYDSYDLNLTLPFSHGLFIKTILLGLLCGLSARIYVDLVQSVRKIRLRLKKKTGLWPPLFPLIGGILLALTTIWIPKEYLGLSIPIMESALHGDAIPYIGFLWKALLVAITLGSGFYGGVVTPQFVIGALTGNAFAHWFGLTPAFGAAIGMIAVPAAASNTPIAAILMGVELFGAESLLPIAGASISAYLLIGHRSIYPDHRLAFSKSSWIETQPDMPIGQGKIRLSYGLLKWWEKKHPKLQDTPSKKED